MADQTNKLLAAVLAIATCIVVLLPHRCPSAVAWFVVPIVVDSVDTVKIRRSASHVDEEVLVGVPVFANRDATSAVVFEHAVVCVLAPAEHSRPRSVLGGFFTIAPFTMSSAFLSTLHSEFDAEAPTRFRLAVSQHVTAQRFFLPTVASAKPRELLADALLGQAQDDPSTATSSGHVSFHGWEGN